VVAVAEADATTAAATGMAQPKAAQPSAAEPGDAAGEGASAVPAVAGVNAQPDAPSDSGPAGLFVDYAVHRELEPTKAPLVLVPDGNG
jgi:hypothetical protein